MRTGVLVTFGILALLAFYAIDGGSRWGSADLTPSDPTMIGATGRVQVVELYADWCSACRASADDVKAVEAEFAGKADFIYLDVDDPNNRPLLRSTFNRSNAIPTFYLLAPDGSIVEHWVGMSSKKHLSDRVENAVARYPARPSESGIDQVLMMIRGGLQVANEMRH
ncbi:MAG: hypothetical protein CUN55_02210 [Phototrophicales bacterium]|nr:MAG: hypothetical protein CUN55_02210 [Phototrophicales bacterium]